MVYCLHKHIRRAESSGNLLKLSEAIVDGDGDMIEICFF